MLKEDIILHIILLLLLVTMMRMFIAHGHILLLFVLCYVPKIFIVRSKYILLRIEPPNEQEKVQTDSGWKNELNDRLIGDIDKKRIRLDGEDGTTSHFNDYLDGGNDYGGGVCQCNCNGCTPKGCSGVKGRSFPRPKGKSSITL